MSSHNMHKRFSCRSPRKLSVALATAAAVVVCGTGFAHAAPLPPVTSQPPPSAQPSFLFDATDGSANYLGSPIPAGAVIDPNSTAIVNGANLGTNIPRVGGPEWQIPIYTTSNADPVYTPKLTKAKSWGCSVDGSMHIPDFATREVPGNGDGWIGVYNVDDGTVKSIWQAAKSGGNWNGTCGGSFPVHGNGFNKIVGVGTGSESQVGAGLMLNSELTAGVVNHALYLTSTNTCRIFREPAGKSDGSGTGSTCWPMGARVQLDPSIDCTALPGATRGEQIVCRTLQIYGGYVLDSGGSGPLSGIVSAGDDLTDPARSPWKTPGNGMRGTRNCAPVSATCGILANLGWVGTPTDLAHIPWNGIRVLARWDGA